MVMFAVEINGDSWIRLNELQKVAYYRCLWVKRRVKLCEIGYSYAEIALIL